MMHQFILYFSPKSYILHRYIPISLMRFLNSHQSIMILVLTFIWIWPLCFSLSETVRCLRMISIFIVFKADKKYWLINSINQIYEIIAHVFVITVYFI